MRKAATVLALLLILTAAPIWGAAKVGGRTSPAGAEIQIDLPGSQMKANIGSPPPNGPGCCVFRSLDHAARWCGEEALYGFPEWMVSKGIAGGGWPEKVDDLIPKIAKDRGLPVPEYIQIQGDDTELIKQAIASGRMACITYSYSATGRYRGKIAHMVNACHYDDQWVAILDNNFVGEDRYEWNDHQSFRRTYSPNRDGWAIILLKHGPPPPPKN